MRRLLLLGILSMRLFGGLHAQESGEKQNNPKIYIAFLWHMHQPIYYPYQSVVQTQQSGHYSFSLYDVHLSRTGPYTSWPKTAVQKGMNANMGHFGAQVSFSGSLIENLNALENAGVGFSNWKSHWNYIKNQNTTLGNPRLDMVGFGYHHPLMGLIDYKDIRKQIQNHRNVYASQFPGAYSKGFFPPETAFSPRMIPALVDEGLEWVIIDNIHFERAAQNAPVGDQSGVLRPNKADVRNPDPGDWVQLNGLWCPSPVSARWAHQPRYVSYTDPQTGVSKKIIGVPASRYLGEEDGRGGFGALNYDLVMSQLEAYNTDPSRPILLLLHHDGDNYGGGSEAYYNHNFQNFVNWLQAQSHRFECTTIQDYLDRFPPPVDDVIHVQDGSWLGAAAGDPQFKKWNGDPGSYQGATGPYSPDRNSWGVMTAAKNIVEAAQQVNASHSGTLQAWHYYLSGQTSCYWYWDGTEIWDSNPTRAANQAVAHAKPVALSGADLTPPAIYLPQRYPYNPGEIEWSAAGVMPTDFTVWTYVFDLSGLNSVQLKYRLSDGPQPDSHNFTYQGGASVGEWQNVSMTGVAIPSITNPIPTHKAQEFSAQINGLSDVLVDYYVVAADVHGNVAKSPIQHVWVGDGSGSTSGNVSWSPLNPNMNEIITIVAKHASDESLLHWGVNNWSTPNAAYHPAGSNVAGVAVQSPPAGQNNEGYYYWQLGPFNNPIQVVEQLDFVFKLSATQWDNNNGNDWHVLINNNPGSNPVGANASITTLINTPYTFAPSDFYFFSPDGAGFNGIQIMALPTVGTFTSNGIPVIAGTDYSDVGSLVFTPAMGASGSPYAQFTFRVKDTEDRYSDAIYTMSIQVVSQNPIGANASVSMLQNQVFYFQQSHFQFFSAVGNQFAGIRIVDLPNKGQLKNGDQVLTHGEIVNDVTQLNFAPVENENGSPYTSFGFRLLDDQGLESEAVYLMQINVIGDFPAGVSWFPVSPTRNDVITIIVSQDSNMSSDTRLHWGVNSWTKPNEVYWPAGTTLWSDGIAARTPFVNNSGDWMVQLGPFNNPAQIVNQLNFVVHYGGSNWNNNGGNDWHIPITNPLDISEQFLKKPSLKVNPNPLKYTASIQIEGDNGQVYLISLLDLSGHQLASEVMTAGEMFVLYKNQLPAGLYLIKAVNQKTKMVLTEKLLVVD